MPKERVTVEGVGDVNVRGLSLYEKEQWQKDAFRVDSKTGSVTISDSDVQLLLRTVHDQHGRRFFGSEDIGRIRSAPALIVEPLLRVAMRLSAIGRSDIEDLVKNSPMDPEPPSEDSNSD